MRKLTPAGLIVAVIATLVAAPAYAAKSCYGRRPTILGSRGADTLRGTDEADVIVALGGNDRVFAGRGPDLVCTGDLAFEGQ